MSFGVSVKRGPSYTWGATGSGPVMAAALFCAYAAGDFLESHRVARGWVRRRRLAPGDARPDDYDHLAVGTVRTTAEAARLLAFTARDPACPDGAADEPLWWGELGDSGGWPAGRPPTYTYLSGVRRRPPECRHLRGLVHLANQAVRPDRDGRIPADWVRLVASAIRALEKPAADTWLAARLPGLRAVFVSAADRRLPVAVG